jgi:hypothetical protein
VKDDAADVLDFCRHYAARRDSNKSANVSWTQSDEARTLRALAVACMTSLRLESRSIERDRRIVKLLKDLGYLSPTTACIDVNVQRIIDDANALIADGWIATT